MEKRDQYLQNALRALDSVGEATSLSEASALLAIVEAWLNIADSIGDRQHIDGADSVRRYVRTLNRR